MATIDWLGAELRAAGCSTRSEGDWTSRGRPGDFAPIGVLWHHTAAVATADDPAPSLGTVIDGRPDLNGPLCHVLLDRVGVCRLIAAGRANHAGVSGGSGPIPAGDGNTLLVGIEIEYDGVDQDITSTQYSEGLKATVAILRRLGQPASHVRGHKETSTTGKIDPTRVNMQQVRDDVRALMG